MQGLLPSLQVVPAFLHALDSAMTQHEASHMDENAPPSTTARRRRSSGAARAGSQSSPPTIEQPLAPVPSTSFYGGSPRVPARPPLHAIRTSEARERRKSADSSQAMEIDIQHKEVTDPPVVGINLDDDDTQFPPSPPSLDDDITQFKATIRYPAVATMHLEGHGYLPNALLGHSSHPAFRLGSAFDWPESFDAGSLLDYEINSTYVPRPTSSKPTQATAQAAPSSSTRSYSQAVGSASPSSAPAAAGKVVSSGGTSSTQQASGSTSSPSKTGTALPKLVSNATIEQARPHPHAYYSMVHQAWTVITPIGMDTQQGSRSPPVTGECMVLRGTGSRKTHHYVRIPHAIDPKCLLRPSQQHYTPAISSPHLYTDHTFGGLSSAPFPNPKDPADPCWSGPPTPSQHCWDVYVCSGCRNAFAVSRANVIPSVWGYSLCQSFVQARVAEEQQKNQPPGDGLVLQSALEYIWKVLRNVLYNGNRLGIPTTGTTFTKRMGKSSAAIALFERLGFSAKVSADNKPMLDPPILTPQTVALLSRAFLELSLWIAGLNSDAAATATSQPQRKEVFELLTLKSFEKALEGVTGPDTTAKYIPSGDQFQNAEGFAMLYKVLGVTPETADEDIAFAYTCQVDTDPRHQLYYFDALVEIATLRGDNREALQVLIATERSRDRYGYTEIVRALATLKLKPLDHPSDRFFNYPVSDWPNEDSIAAAYHESKEDVPKRQGSESDLKELKDAVVLLAKATRSELLQVVIESASPAKPTVGEMTVEEAFTYLQATKDVTDNVLCSAVSITFFMDDTASEFQKEKARVALGIIAEDRKSSGIKQFLQTGLVPEVVEAPREAPISVDRPAGLQNIGNTCYLNSLLQYFFTIRELRDVVLEFDKYQETRPFEEIENSKRVGGRNITRREIERSRKFTKLLSQLFYELIHEKVASIRPTRDLAYLALVSSKDEDATPLPLSQQDPASSTEAKTVAGPTTNEMKVDDEPTVQSPSGTVSTDVGEEGLAAAQSVDSSGADTKVGSPSILGKRTSDHFDEDGSQMDVDAVAPTVHVGSPEALAAKEAALQTPVGPGDELTAQEAKDGVVEIVPMSETEKATSLEVQEKARSPPPLPPRNPSTTIAETNMMFGRQNDVSEAMDNVIFQIESALDDSKIPRSSDPPILAGKPCSFVQSLFYGSTLQTLDFEEQREGKRVKEETFGYQLVDVAKDGNDLYDGLDAAFAPSTVEIEGKKAIRQDVLTQLPSILQIQLQRVQFDRSTSRVYKSNAYMPFPQTLRMGRYLSPDGRSDDFAAKQSRSSQLRVELTKLQAKLAKLQQKDEDQQTLPDMLNTAADSLRQLSQVESTEEDFFTQELRQIIGDDEANLLALLPQHAGAIDTDILDIKQRLDACRREVEEIWSDDVENEYELSSVFIHLGAAGYGHYYLYQRALPHQPDRWLKFNDESVTDVEVSEVFADTTGSTANPYWLTYVRKSEIAQRVDAVCRNFV